MTEVEKLKIENIIEIERLNDSQSDARIVQLYDDDEEGDDMPDLSDHESDEDWKL